MLLLFIASALCHGITEKPPPIGFTTPRRVLQKGRDGCGLESKQLYSNPSKPFMVIPGQKNTFSYTIVNEDGAGELEVFLDSSGTGQNWRKIRVLKNIPGTQGDLLFGSLGGKKFPIKASYDVDIPLDFQCRTSHGSCLLRVYQRREFGSCGWITTPPL